ncbi:MAG: aldo/keto reductase [Ignavibacteriaceae bacterium]|nr:MAG: aldo/keto reductase [Chlorobi bacterium OLB4]MBV6399358.1 hypothetical protein [Ignavibacteria bacterium]MBW7856572.1 aldo/keto reductase [Ignavibacteria bacterium]MCC6886803.1 aldo/keto reductase [Ignavibacteriales bacterium]MEB2329895.1 aldo/keto reductase [Ignavibacteriaceae bacterium]
MKELTPLGFGGYRIDNRFAEHSDALSYALTSGISVIDTSSNYSDGRSELLIGNVLYDLFNAGTVNREDLTVITKVGYLQGQNYKSALKRENTDKQFHEVVKYSEGLWHCIHPEFLENQLSHQLSRLNLKFIDIYLLHNPEYFLIDSKKRNVDSSVAQQEYYRRIKDAFIFLESKVRDGSIGAYGVSSNTFPLENDEYTFTSLENLNEIASEISYESNFKFIQLPFNIIEPGALLTKNQLGGSLSTLDYARNNGIKVLVNRPFNTISSKGLVRTVDYETGVFIEKDFVAGLTLCRRKETELNKFLREKGDFHFANQLVISGEVEKNWKSFGSIENFNDMLEYFFSPRLNNFYDLAESCKLEGSVLNLFDEYISSVNIVLNLLGNYYRNNNASKNKFFHLSLNKYLPEEFHKLPLSQKTLQILRSVEGVECILVGARKKKYVDDIIGVLDLPKLNNSYDIIKSLHSDMINAEYHSADL